jgi:hypothetical protein
MMDAWFSSSEKMTVPGSDARHAMTAMLAAKPASGGQGGRPRVLGPRGGGGAAARCIGWAAGAAAGRRLRASLAAVASCSRQGGGPGERLQPCQPRLLHGAGAARSAAASRPGLGRGEWGVGVWGGQGRTRGEEQAVLRAFEPRQLQLQAPVERAVAAHQRRAARAHAQLRRGGGVGAAAYFTNSASAAVQPPRARESTRRTWLPGQGLARALASTCSASQHLGGAGRPSPAGTPPRRPCARPGGWTAPGSR